jgi:hypothetical protein
LVGPEQYRRGQEKQAGEDRNAGATPAIDQQPGQRLARKSEGVVEQPQHPGLRERHRVGQVGEQQARGGVGTAVG